jgi:hypothetical protein
MVFSFINPKTIRRPHTGYRSNLCKRYEDNDVHWILCHAHSNGPSLFLFIGFHCLLGDEVSAPQKIFEASSNQPRSLRGNGRLPRIIFRQFCSKPIYQRLSKGGNMFFEHKIRNTISLLSYVCLGIAGGSYCIPWKAFSHGMFTEAKPNSTETYDEARISFYTVKRSIQTDYRNTIEQTL